MTDLLFSDVRLAAPAGPVDGWLRTAGSRIRALGAGAPPSCDDVLRVDGAGAVLLPGFVDPHVHGVAGHDTMDADVAGLHAMARFLATRGVTGFLATTWTGDDAATGDALAAVRAAMRDGRDPAGASLLGAHLEGPYLNPRRAGAQDSCHIRAVDREEAARYLDSGVVRVITLAPEVFDGDWLVDACIARGIVASAGHTEAGYDALVAAAARGVRQITHMYNGMPPLHHREPGAVGAALLVPGLRCELIADGVHVSAPAMRLLFELRGTAGTMLVSDAVRAAGLPDGDHRIGSRTATLAGGAIRYPGGELAGSVATLDTALRALVDATGVEAARLWRTTSANAASAAGVAARTGTLAPGLDADLVLLDERLEVRMTVVEGRVAFARDDEGAAR